ncbi:hypothetical protein FH972_008530 [Carpinus fangiana]|uniref:Uncharacterized protein n=1 Tax=Carpinus fangiana TaxID=176857 RepID=A0A5N6R1T7_9ROSI|nr:hypothetical protein FH972_008530 [Carpinus fangiana]
MTSSNYQKRVFASSHAVKLLMSDSRHPHISTTNMEITVGITYAAAVVGQNTRPGVIQSAGDGVQKAKPPEGIMSATLGVGKKDMAGENPVAGDGASKMVLEGANFPGICSGDHAHQEPAMLRPQYQGEITQGLKESLLSLQREVANCLYKLEMGWVYNGKGGQMNQEKGENVLKVGPHKEVGPGCIRPSPANKSRTQPITRYYAKTYVRRRPRRQLRWRPKHMGRVKGQVIGESSENSRSRSPKHGTDPDHADKRNEELAGICGEASDIANKITEQPSTGDVPVADTPIGEEGASHAGSDAEMAESVEEVMGGDIGGTGTLGEDKQTPAMAHACRNPPGPIQELETAQIMPVTMKSGDLVGQNSMARVGRELSGRVIVPELNKSLVEEADADKMAHLINGIPYSTQFYGSHQPTDTDTGLEPISMTQAE